MRGRAVSLVVLLLGACAAGQPARAQNPPLHELQAAFVYQFTRLVEWPPAALDRTFKICVASEDVFRGSLHALFRGELVHGRPAEVMAIPYPDGDCRVLFIPNRSSAGVYLRESRDRPVLTIGDAPNFLTEGGIIRLFLEGNNLRFALNLDAAQRGGLRLSSRLVELARPSHGRDE